MKECLKKAKAIQKMIENQIFTNNGETKNHLINEELDTSEMKIDAKKFTC